MERMGRTLMWVLLLALIIVVGGTGYLMFAEPDFEPRHVEKVVPDAKLGR
jgi:hypothetical protein